MSYRMSTYTVFARSYGIRQKTCTDRNVLIFDFFPVFCFIHQPRNHLYFIFSKLRNFLLVEKRRMTTDRWMDLFAFLGGPKINFYKKRNFSVSSRQAGRQGDIYYITESK